MDFLKAETFEPQDFFKGKKTQKIPHRRNEKRKS